MHKKFFVAAVICAALGIGGYVWFTNVSAPHLPETKKMRNTWDGDYQVSYTGECNKPPKPRSPIFSGQKFIEVLDGAIVEIDGVAPAAPSIITNGKATVVFSVPGGSQETDVLTFSRAVDGNYYEVVDSFSTTAGCYGTGTGQQVNTIPGLRTSKMDGKKLKNCTLNTRYTFLHKQAGAGTADLYGCYGNSEHVMEVFFKGKKRFDTIVIPDIAYQESHQNLGYILENGEEFCPVINGEKKKCYESVSMAKPSSFSPNGERFFYIVFTRAEKKYFMVIDGQEGAHYDWVGSYYLEDVIFSPDGKRSAYMAGRDGKTFIIVDGVETGPYEEIYSSKGLTFSEDGREIFYTNIGGRVKKISQ